MNPLHKLSTVVALAVSSVPCAIAVAQADPNDPGIREPSLSTTTGQDVRIPNTDQANGETQLNVVGSGAGSAGSPGSVLPSAVGLAEQPLAQPDGARRDLDQLIRFDVLQRRFQRQRSRRGEHDG